MAEIIKKVIDIATLTSDPQNVDLGSMSGTNFYAVAVLSGLDGTVHECKIFGHNGDANTQNPYVFVSGAPLITDGANNGEYFHIMDDDSALMSHLGIEVSKDNATEGLITLTISVKN